MESADYWRLCDHISVFQAIMLILGYDPSDQLSWQIEGNKRSSPPQGYGALKTAISNAIISEQIKAISRPAIDQDYGGEIPNSIDIDTTMLSVNSLKEYLKAKGFNDGFFFPEGTILEEYLDKNNPCYAPKLAAAVNAWKVITNNPELQKGKTPKQALEKWLRENASKYNLTKDDGTPNETGIQEISKIANWKPEGGAAKTPTPSIVQDNSPPSTKKPYKLRVFGQSIAISDELEDDIPF